MKRSLNRLRLKYKRLFIPLLIIQATIVGSIVGGGCSHNRSKVSPTITTLDSILQHSDDFTLKQLTRIAEVKHLGHQAKTIEDRFLYNNLIFENYFTLNADSALRYADLCLEIAKESGNREWLTRSLINKANLLAATGLLKEALDTIDNIDTSELNENQVIDYYGLMIYLYSHMGNYAEGTTNDYYVTERVYKDSIMNIITPAHPEYLWYKGWDILGTNQNPDSIIGALKEKLANSELNERQDAKNAYILGRLFQQKGDLRSYENNMALAAIIDVKIANYEIAALEELATLMFNNGAGDVDRAYSYINFCLNRALNYPNRTKAFGVSKTLEKINDAYQERLRKQQRNTTVFLVLVCILAAILIVAVVAIVMQNKKLSRQRQAVNDANQQLNQKVEQLSEADEKLNNMNQLLKELNSDLKSKNEQLYESNFVKEEYIGYVFTLCSNYIAKIEELKKNIYLKAIKKQYKEIETETADLGLKEDLKEFYHSFDTIFLNLYPNFVSDFNSLLKPDKQIILKEGELLNMELRIYALVRLGINDSVKISDFLHCAPQTVYNYRLRTRSRALLPKEDFIEKVKSLGNFLGKE